MGLARLYATKHGTMATSPPCKAYHFPGGVTNGAEWYVLEGGMQDFNYHFSNCVELTLELSCCKHPPASQLPREWEHNREALLSYLEAAQAGVRGVVTSRGRALGGATVEVAGIEKHVQTTERGEYWRLLAPGSYRCLCSITCIILTKQIYLFSVRAVSGPLASDWTQVTVGSLESKEHVLLNFTLNSDQNKIEGR